MIDFGSLFAWSKDTELKESVTSDTVLLVEDGTFHVILGKSMIGYVVYVGWRIRC